ncbi:MAG: hypothetical protein JNL28_01240 [Planctomycetes bacterium]|nr:hypothetical protein [Planctomycetota bacterium]
MAVMHGMFWWGTSCSLVAIFASIPILVVLLASMRKVGASNAVRIAEEHAHETGRVRSSTHRPLAFALIAVGVTCGLASVASFLVPAFSPTQSAALQRARLSLGIAAFLLIRWGLRRPWDLKIVEREERDVEVAA